MIAILTYRNRTIPQDDIAFIQKGIVAHHAEGRTAISRLIRQTTHPLTRDFQKRIRHG